MDARSAELSQTLTSLDDPIFVLNREGFVAEVYGVTAGMTGLEPAAWVGRHYREILPVRCSRDMDRGIAALRAGDRVFPFEYSLGSEDRPTWWSAKVTARRDPDGRLVGAIVLSREITTARRESACRADLPEASPRDRGGEAGAGVDLGNLEFRDLFSVEEIQQIQDAFAAATGVASIITDVDGVPITRASNFCHLCEHVIRATPKGRQNCRHSDAIIGRVHPGGPVIQRCLSGGLTDGGTSIMAGDRHIANWLIGQVRDPSVPEEVSLAYADEIGADREVYRRALQSVTAMTAEKFARVCEALHHIGAQISKLAYRNLQQAQLMAERRKLEDQLRQSQKLEAIGQLAGGVAHDFNNILAVQMLQLNLLAQREDLPAEVQDAVTTLQAGAQSASSLTQQLLAFGRRSILQVAKLDLSAQLARLHRLMTRTLREDIALSYRSPAHAVKIAADPVMIEQVFMNLLINARDAIAGHGRIEIVLEEDLAAREACVTVSDSGCGMDEATRARIFEPFFTTKAKGCGTGLGLATVYGIIEQHRGSIQVSSAPGCGSTFVVRFPMVEADDPPVDVVSGPMVRPARGRGQSILVVEDDPQVRSVVVCSLKHLGYDPIEAGEAAEALAIWASRRSEIRAVITDMVMPGAMTGADLARRILTENAAIKVIVASGYSHDLAADGAPSEGAITYLQKPYELSRLAALLAELLPGA